ARRTAQQDGLAERAMKRQLEALQGLIRCIHAITAPPAKLKKLRKKEEAANAIESPKTIWISLRKPPPVSPKASARPVVMMMITATILATGPCTESRIDCSGPSQGMPEPAARAGVAIVSNRTSIAPCPGDIWLKAMKRCGLMG